jgi:hypothetical protein
LLCIETADRPGLLMEVVKAIADINVSVESGEFDTEVTSCPCSHVLSLYHAKVLLQDFHDWENCVSVWKHFFLCTCRDYWPKQSFMLAIMALLSVIP